MAVIRESGDAAGSSETTVRLAVGDSFIGSTDVANFGPDERDWVAIDLEAGMSYIFQLEVADTGSTTYPSLRIHNSFGEQVSDLTATTTGYLGVRQPFDATESGTYFIDVSLTRPGGYTLSTAGTQTVEQNTRTDTPFSARPGESYAGILGQGDGLASGDWVRVLLTAGQDYRITFKADGLSGNTPPLRLRDREGEEISVRVTVDNETNTATIEGTAAESGIHYIELDPGIEGAFALTFDQVDLAPDLTEMHDSTARDERYALNGGGTFEGYVGDTDEEDWIAFMGAEGQHYTLTFTNPDALSNTVTIRNSSFDLIDQTGEEIETSNPAYSDFSDIDGTISFSGVLLEEGQYYIAVTEGAGDYTVTLTLEDVVVDVPTPPIDGVVRPNTDTPLRLTGTNEADFLTGENQTDTLVGMGGDDILIGGWMTIDLGDRIFAGDGNDYARGGWGNDELRGDAGNDTLLGGFGADTVIGGTGNDEITGNAGSDILFGGDGDDYFNGGWGNDRINGGAGADSFHHLGSAGFGSDWIQDYSAAQGDVLVFDGIASRSDFRVNTGHTPDAGAARTAEAFVIYLPTHQILWALVDGAGQTDINLQIGNQTFDLIA